MTAKVTNVAAYDFKPDDELLLDTNIWLFVYGPQKFGDRRVRIYSEAFKKILVARSCVYMDVLIISEFINRYARMKWKIIAPEGCGFKEFRKSVDFKPIAQEIAAVLGNILEVCLPVDYARKALDIAQLIDEYATRDSDFNDQVISALCRENEWKLVTDDSDFSNRGLFLVTANRQLLA